MNQRGLRLHSAGKTKGKNKTGSTSEDSLGVESRDTRAARRGGKTSVSGSGMHDQKEITVRGRQL